MFIFIEKDAYNDIEKGFDKVGDLLGVLPCVGDALSFVPKLGSFITWIAGTGIKECTVSGLLFICEK